MAVPRRAVMYIALILIILLILLAIYGAFIGQNRAEVFFNSAPVAAYWIFLAVILLSGIFVFKKLLRIPALLLVHLGCVFIIAGALAGSKTGQSVLSGIFGSRRVGPGNMLIYVGQREYRVFVTRKDSEGMEVAEVIGKLPFEIFLKDFRTDYYPTGRLYIRTADGKDYSISARVGNGIELGSRRGRVSVVGAYKNCKIRIEQGTVSAVEGPEYGSNPAVQLRITFPDGSQDTKYVFERFSGHDGDDDRIRFRYQRDVKDWISDVQVVRDGRILAEKSIEVNHPLHFGGYHFYQHSYDEQNGRYTILQVVSDSGLSIVYTGFAMLLTGVFWRFWATGCLRKDMRRVSTGGS